MSITFSLGWYEDDERLGKILRHEHCDCKVNYCNACDALERSWQEGQPFPTMPDSASFSCEVCNTELNLSISNALDLLEWLGLGREQWGHIEAKELAARCWRRLWDEKRNQDPPLEGYRMAEPGHAQLIVAGRRPGYLRENTERLLKLAERADGKLVAWS